VKSTRKEVACCVRIELKANNPSTNDIRGSIRAQDESKGDISWRLNTQVRVQVRQGKGNRIKESNKSRTGVTGQERN